MTIVQAVRAYLNAANAEGVFTNADVAAAAGVDPGDKRNMRRISHALRNDYRVISSGYIGHRASYRLAPPDEPDPPEETYDERVTKVVNAVMRLDSGEALRMASTDDLLAELKRRANGGGS